jgi:hypothetical protein
VEGKAGASEGLSAHCLGQNPFFRSNSNLSVGLGSQFAWGDYSLEKVLFAIPWGVLRRIILEKVLTGRHGPVRVIPEMGSLTPFQRVVQSALGEEKIEHAAKRCGIPRHVIDDLFRKASVPRAKYFDKLCDGLGIDKRQAALAAHGIEDTMSTTR